jgi:signal transduction histidine kinase/DNA-binding response OmpR family regulator/CHASE3 domain sensor protein
MSTFKRNLLVGYGVLILLLIIASVASYTSINNLLDSSKLVNNTNQVINKLDNVISVLKDAETGQRGYLLTDDERFLEPYHGAYDRSILLINQIKQLTSHDAQQQVDSDLLKSIATKRLNFLAYLVEEKRSGRKIEVEKLLEGKVLMDNARKIVQTMQAREQSLLEQRTSQLNRFTTATPILIVIASILAIIVTIISFIKVLADYNKRTQLQQALQNKDEEISERIAVIQNIAEQVSAGNYQLKIEDAEGDALGSIAGALNKMTESLDYSFTRLKEREWLQTGIAQLNDIMIGEKHLYTLTYNVIEFLASYTKSQAGAFYLTKNEKTIALSASIALNKDVIKSEFKLGEGLAGQSALSGREIYLQSIADADMVIDFSGGSIKPKAIIAIPVFYEKILKGVIELASIECYSPIALEFIRSAVFNIGLAIHSARDHQRLQDFLHETQAQAEELQSQHNELENVNAELEAQAEKLQASEEELKVQQEELQQINQELEERSRLLEERNELILERNLEIQKKAEELQLSTKYKSEFLANMSHELRTPLNSILLLSRLLSENHENNLSKDQIEYTNVIQSSGKGLLTLIDEILDLSKIESGKMELEYSDVNLEGIAEELTSLFEPMAREKGIDFTVSIEEGTSSIIETDNLRLGQILRNLISNALKFTKKGSVTIHIKRENGIATFSVKDTGIGIPIEKQQTIFEAFQQADGSTRREYGGTGLGLSISRELAKLLGGTIKLISEEGKGSEFILTIPASKDVKKLPEKNASTAKQESLQKEKDFIDPLKDKQYLADFIPAPIPDDRDRISEKDKAILIIEDDTNFAKSLLEYTRNKGYKGLVAVRGDEGIVLAKKFKPLGILLDVQLPVKSGWEVMEELKADKDTRPIPVHMMSAFEVRTKGLSKGAVDFINKPIAFEKLGEMFQKIEQALSKHPKKVLIVEENPKHAQALALFLESYHVSAEIKNTVDEGVKALHQNEADCVILDMGFPAQRSFDVLEDIKKTPGFENLPIIVFTGKNLSHMEEMKIRQYADSIVIKTAHSYQRILDEVSLFLHLVEENNKEGRTAKYKNMGELSEVLKDKTILIADDDVRNIFSLTKSLESYGMKVISAIDGKDAINQLEAHDKVDLVLMDMMMPEMDGYDSTRRIRELPKYKNLPIIAVTAKAMTGDREKCINAGASDYITKPVDVDQLISLLRVWLYH